MDTLKNLFKANPVEPRFKNIGDIVSGFYELAFYIVTALTFVWFVWAVFEYLLAGGDKQKLASARSRITWALVGLFVVAMAYAIARFAEEILMPKGGGFI